MDYVLFKGFERIGSFYPNVESAKDAITGAGIYNVCGVVGENGKIKIVTRESVVIK